MYDHRNDEKGNDENPVGNAVEIKVTGRIILACISAIFLAVTYRAVKWIAGF